MLVMVWLKLCVGFRGGVTSVSLVCEQRTHSKRGEAVKLGQWKAAGKEAKDELEEEEEWVGTGPRPRSWAHRTGKPHPMWLKEDLQAALTVLWLPGWWSLFPLLRRKGSYSSCFPRAQSHWMLPARRGNKLGTLGSDMPRCFTEKDLMEQLFKVLSDRKNKYVLWLSIKCQLNSTIIVEPHTEHSVQASLMIGEWTKISILADQMKKQKWNPSIFLL